MSVFKLQISCIIIICFLFVLFAAERNLKKQTRKLFAVTLFVSALEILFEILALWTVQNMSTVSPFLFNVVHRIYLMLVLTFFYMNYRYKSAFIKEETGFTDKGLVFIHTVQLILYIGIFLLPLGYDATENGGEFTYGPGVWVVYVGAAFYLFVTFSNYCEQGRRIAKEKLLPLILGVGTGMCICFFYMSVPSSEISSLGIAIMNVAFYLSLRCREQEKTLEKNCEKIESMQKPEEDMKYQVSFEAPGARVLIVDDSEINRKVVRNLLKRTKMQIDEASCGRECLELVRKNFYDLIFMDHVMPEMDGIETFEIMKKEKICKNMAVIAMTAGTTQCVPEDYRKLGFAAFLSKPVIPKELETMAYGLLDKEKIVCCEKSEIPSTQQKACAEKEMQEDAKKDMPEEKEEWNTLPALDGMDYNYSALHFKTPEELKEMIQFLTAVMPSDAEEAKKYYDHIYDRPALRDFQTKLHSMKNSAMTIGIIPLAGLAKTLEDAARENRIEQIHALMPVFMEKWESYRILLTEKFGEQAGDRSQGNPDSQEIQELFGSLRRAAEEMDIDELDSCMKKIDRYIFPPEYEDKLQKIRLAVLNFDVEYLQEEGYLSERGVING